MTLVSETVSETCDPQAISALREAAGDTHLECETGHSRITLSVEKDVLEPVCSVLRDHPELQCTYPADLCATDTGKQIVLWYRFWSFSRGLTATVQVSLGYDDLHVPTLTRLWPGLDWHERECFDLFGVIFDGHRRSGDARKMRLLLPEDWEGHPFRKDYRPVFSGDPLSGPQETN